LARSGGRNTGHTRSSPRFIRNKEVNNMAKRVGFIGLGMMGTPMSKNLLKVAFDLTVWNRTQSKMREILELGAKPASSAKEVAQKSEVTITMLSGPSDVEQVILGKDGVLEGLKPGSVVIDMSTISPEVSRRVGAEVAKAGSTMLDAPVGGSVGVAASAALTIQVGGEKHVFEAHRDIFAAMGKNIFYIGENGMGCYLKLLGNAIMGTNMAVLGEALCLGAKAGIPVETMVEVLKTTGAASRVMETRGPNIVKGDYKAQFMLKLLFKDMGLALETAAVDSIPMPISGLVRQIYAQAIVDGRGNEDFSAVVGTAEKLSKVTPKR
jgi:3-hydroxyisobutyrate dehydrogenase-like beta-hydroxyacid dehydrogenase